MEYHLWFYGKPYGYDSMLCLPEFTTDYRFVFILN